METERDGEIACCKWFSLFLQSAPSAEYVLSAPLYPPLRSCAEGYVRGQRAHLLPEWTSDAQAESAVFATRLGLVLGALSARAQGVSSVWCITPPSLPPLPLDQTGWGCSVILGMVQRPTQGCKPGIWARAGGLEGPGCACHRLGDTVCAGRVGAVPLGLCSAALRSDKSWLRVEERPSAARINLVGWTHTREVMRATGWGCCQEDTKGAWGCACPHGRGQGASVTLLFPARMRTDAEPGLPQSLNGTHRQTGKQTQNAYIHIHTHINTYQHKHKIQNTNIKAYSDTHTDK